MDNPQTQAEKDRELWEFLRAFRVEWGQRTAEIQHQLAVINSHIETLQTDLDDLNRMFRDIRHATRRLPPRA